MIYPPERKAVGRTWTHAERPRRSASWTKAEIRAARRMPLKPLLEDLGLRLVPAGEDNYRVDGAGGGIVVKEHYWISPDSGASGNAIDFLVKIRGMSFSEAMRMLLGNRSPGT